MVPPLVFVVDEGRGDPGCALTVGFVPLGTRLFSSLPSNRFDIAPPVDLIQAGDDADEVDAPDLASCRSDWLAIGPLPAT